MVFRFAFRNIRKSITDYVIYFVTLMLGVALFYTYQAMLEQRITEKLLSLDYDKMALLSGSFKVATVMVTMILAFLIMYASGFFMRRKRKEFAVYMLLGLKKKTIAGVLMMENLIVGGISLLIGLIGGFILSQGVSVLVVHIFEADMSVFSFEVSAKATLQTILCFAAIYLLVMIWDIIVVGKAKLITLMNAEKRMEKNTARNPILCTIVFVISIIILGHTYYRAIFEQELFSTEMEIIMELVKGMVSTYFIFWSLSGLFVFGAKLRKKFYLRGLRLFTTKELSSRINTNSFAMGSICLLLFVSICIFSVCLSINYSLNGNLEKLTPVDINLVKWVNASYTSEGEEPDTSPISKVLDEEGIDRNAFVNETEVILYEYDDEWNGDENYFNRFLLYEYVMSLSDYQKVVALYGLEEISLQENEYAIVCNYASKKRAFHQDLSEGRKIELSGRELKPVRKECYDGFVEMAPEYSNLGFFVVPDSVIGKDDRLYMGIRYYLANINPDYEMSEKFNQSFSKQEEDSIGANGCYLVTKDSVRQRAVNFAGMIAFVGIYLGIICVLASVALLSLKEMSQAVDNSGKYRILQGLGVDKGMMNQSVLVQSLIFFMLPLVLAIAHSAIGIYVCMHIMEDYGFSGMLPGITLSAFVILIIYLIYFLLTYRCSCRIVGEK